MRACLYSTIGVDWDLPLVPHWMAHHLELGVHPDDFYLALHSNDNTTRFAEAERLLARFGVAPKRLWTGPFSSDENFKVRQAMFQLAALDDDDWFLIADADEFPVYPDELRRYLRRCGEDGYNALEGQLIDRVCVERTLPPVYQTSSLNEQFPNSVCLTTDVLRMNDRKIVAHRQNTFSGRLYRANHGIVPEYQSTTRVLRDACEINHFKWNAALLGKLRNRIQHYQSIGRQTDASKSSALLQWWQQHQTLPTAKAA